MEDFKAEYYENGFIVLRNIIPDELVKLVQEDSLSIAEAMAGDASYVHVNTFAHSKNLAIYDRLENLAIFKKILTDVFSDTHEFEYLGGRLMCEADELCVTCWHRDSRENGMGVGEPAWDFCETYYGSANSIQIPFLKDDNLWVVPGSHHRRDSDEERAMFPLLSALHNKEPLFVNMGNALKEKMIYGYITSMPNAQCVELNPGDLSIVDVALGSSYSP